VSKAAMQDAIASLRRSSFDLRGVYFWDHELRQLQVALTDAIAAASKVVSPDRDCLHQAQVELLEHAVRSTKTWLDRVRRRKPIEFTVPRDEAVIPAGGDAPS